MDYQRVIPITKTVKDGIVYRAATKVDCVEIRRLIQELAEFQKMPNGPKVDARTLEKDGFSSNPPWFHCIVAELEESEVKKGEPAQLVGSAFYSFTYSTWKGKSMFLDDLYVATNCRRKGVGSQLFHQVAQVAVANDCQRINFVVLDWNPAKAFYMEMGAVDTCVAEAWHWHNMDRSTIERLAELKKV